MVARLLLDGVDDGEAEFALGEIFAEALVGGVGGGVEVEVVVRDLEVEADEVDEGDEVGFVVEGACLHDLDGEAEEPAGFVADHFQVVFLARAGEGVAPEEIHALPAMQIAELVGVDPDDLRVVEFQQFLQGLEVDVVGGIDGLGGAEDAVGDWVASTEEGVVFDVVDEKRGGVEHGDYAGDDLEGGGGDLEPGVEGGDQVPADIFARVVHHVVEGTEEDLFLAM